MTSSTNPTLNSSCSDDEENINIEENSADGSEHARVSSDHSRIIHDESDVTEDEDYEIYSNEKENKTDNEDNDDVSIHSERSNTSSEYKYKQAASLVDTSLPFSISRLLANNNNSNSFSTQNIIKVPAHKPSVITSSSGLTSNSASIATSMLSSVNSLHQHFSPWLHAIDPANILHRNAAVAAFASQVVKDRLSGKWNNFDYYERFAFWCIICMLFIYILK